MTERLTLERRAFLDLLRMANEMVSPETIAQQLAVLAQHLSNCEAVAVRLKRGPDFPFAASLGFSERFITLENDLCERDTEGHLQRDAHHRPILACMCGRVLCEQIDATHPCFTSRGSFVTGSTSALLACPTSLKPLGNTRNSCPAAGFETIGLFPIRRDGVTYGLIQCNDSRPHRLKAQNIDLIENLAATAAHLFQLAMA
jgi:hypothetical protein